MAIRCVALSGGVGGARLSHGLAQALPPGSLTVVVNTGDDFDHLGLRICPDLDTVLYTLAGLAHEEQGWGLAGETFAAMEMLERYGGPTWFRLGDRDLATHLERTRLLAEGLGLAEVTRRLAHALGLTARVLPMCEEPVATRVRTSEGNLLDFQDWFVRRAQQDAIAAVEFEGIERARPGPGVGEALADADLVVLCPSNPFVSLAPILAVPGLALGPGRKVAVSPILGGQAVKGPAAAMLRSLGHEVSAMGVARLYAGVVDAFVLDEVDLGLASEVERLGMQALVMPTMMKGPEGRLALAERLLERVPA